MTTDVNPETAHGDRTRGPFCVQDSRLYPVSPIDDRGAPRETQERPGGAQNGAVEPQKSPNLAPEHGSAGERSQSVPHTNRTRDGSQTAHDPAAPQVQSPPVDLAVMPMALPPLPDGTTVAIDSVNHQVLEACPRWAPSQPVQRLHGNPHDLVLIAVPEGLGATLAGFLADQLKIVEAGR